MTVHNNTQTVERHICSPLQGAAGSRCKELPHPTHLYTSAPWGVMVPSFTTSGYLGGGGGGGAEQEEGWSAQRSTVQQAASHGPVQLRDV